MGLNKQGYILVGRVVFSLEETNWFHYESFWELLILGQNMSEILNWVTKIFALDFELGKESWNSLDGDVKSLSNPCDTNLRRCRVKDTWEFSALFFTIVQ